MINLNSVNRIYFVGIGGIGMSAAASLAREMGFEVSGSDSKQLYAPAKDVLEDQHIDYFVGYDAGHIQTTAADVYVISAGEDLHNPEVKYIYDHNFEHISFAELLGALAENNLRIVVAGTHGKSTTTGLLGHVLRNLDGSSFMAGAVIRNYHNNFYSGGGHYFVFEGDEYKSEFDDPTPKFHYYKPDILILNNLEYDHPDLFSSFEEMEQEFVQLIEAMPADGLIIYNADDITVSRLVHETSVSSVSFGIDHAADYKAEHISYEGDYTTLDVYNKFSKSISGLLLNQTEQYKTQLPGKMNAYNTLAVIAVLRALGFQRDQIALELLSFQGMKRRFEIIEQKNGITVIDDYAHHPTAVRQTLQAARLKYPGKIIWAVFEPHTYSRTEATLDELTRSFDAADEVLISKIYPAREKAREGIITSEQVVQKIKDQKSKIENHIRVVQTKQEALDILKSELKTGDVVVVMAVGGFNQLAYDLKNIL